MIVLKQMFGIFTVYALLFGGWSVFAMGSANYAINWDSLNSGGRDESSSTNYQLIDTAGEQATGSSTSASYTLQAGYRFGDTDATILSFEIGTQENGTRVAYSAFNNAGKTVTVTTAVDFSVGNFIGVIENTGAAERVAIGKITSIVGTVLTVDAWTGDQASISASPAGGDDFVYRLQGAAAQLGNLSTNGVATSLTRTNVISNVPTGYTVYVNTDGNLRSGGSFIANVGDGAVSASSEEYGASTLGATATSTGSDFALATSTRAIQQSASFADGDRVGLIYKAAISHTTAATNYSQQVYYTITANF